MATVKYQNEIQDIILKADARLLVDTAKKIAAEMIVLKESGKDRGKLDEKKSVSTSQIRNIYGSSKKIEMALREENVGSMYGRLILLKPKMAYANGRHNKNSAIRGFTTLVDSLSCAIDLVDADYERMKTFFNFFEAILAYHKAEGGK